MADPEASNTVLGILGSVIVALLGKLGWDKHQKSLKQATIRDEEVTLDSPISHKDSVMIWLTDRVHRVINEVNIPITKNTASIEELKIRSAYQEKELENQKSENATKIARIHEHIDKRFDKLDERLDKVDELVEKLRSRE